MEPASATRYAKSELHEDLGEAFIGNDLLSHEFNGDGVYVLSERSSKRVLTLLKEEELVKNLSHRLRISYEI